MKNEDVMPNSPRQVRSGLPLIICGPLRGGQNNTDQPASAGISSAFFRFMHDTSAPPG